MPRTFFLISCSCGHCCYCLNLWSLLKCRAFSQLRQSTRWVFMNNSSLPSGVSGTTAPSIFGSAILNEQPRPPRLSACKVVHKRFSGPWPTWELWEFQAQREIFGQNIWRGAMPASVSLAICGELAPLFLPPFRRLTLGLSWRIQL